MSSPFSSSSFADAPPILLLAPCRCQPPHPGPPSAASSSHPLPDRRLLELHPVPMHADRSSPDNPSGPSPPLLPTRCAPPRTAHSSLSSAESTTPWALRCRVWPPRTVSCRPPPPHRELPTTPQSSFFWWGPPCPNSPDGCATLLSRPSTTSPPTPLSASRSRRCRRRPSALPCLRCGGSLAQVAGPAWNRPASFAQFAQCNLPFFHSIKNWLIQIKSN
jgi:hypothetical protein